MLPLGIKSNYSKPRCSYTQSHAANVRSRLLSSASVKEAICSFFEGVVAEEYDEGPNLGCFCINTMVELAPHDEKFEILTREHQMYLSTVFQETIERGIRSGELEATTDARALAHTMISLLIGITVMMKSRPERSFVDHAVATTLMLLK